MTNNMPRPRCRLYVEHLEDRCVLAFLTPMDYSVCTYTTDVKVGDFNGDSISDVAVQSYFNPQGVGVLLGNGDGTLPSARNTGIASPLSMAVGDFNADGKLDLAARSDDVIGENSINVLLGREDGTFAYAPLRPTGSGRRPL